jgi:hypothetical protein
MMVLEQAQGIPRMGYLYEFGSQWLGILENDMKDLYIRLKRDLERIQAKIAELDSEEEALGTIREGGVERIKGKGAEGLWSVL